MERALQTDLRSSPSSATCFTAGRYLIRAVMLATEDNSVCKERRNIKLTQDPTPEAGDNPFLPALTALPPHLGLTGSISS